MAGNTFIKGFEEFEKAIQRNREFVRKETGIYLKRAQAALHRQMKEAPWRIGSVGGGTPRASGNLRQAIRTPPPDLNTFTARITADSSAAKYAIWVHEGTKKMKARPWMEYAKEQKEKEILRMQDDLLKNIVGDLAR